MVVKLAMAKFTNFRLYGEQPSKIILLHGGPGALGEMQPVALELAKDYGCLEALQTKLTIRELLQELQQQLTVAGRQPVVLVGFSWGAMLALLLTAEFPQLVEKLVLIGCPPLTKSYDGEVDQTRSQRISPNQQQQLAQLMAELETKTGLAADRTLLKLGQLLGEVDAYDRMPNSPSPYILHHNFAQYSQIWQQAEQLRSSNKFLEIAAKISQPICFIQGDYDPHPIEALRGLEEQLPNARLEILTNCGHKPWVEVAAAAKFYTILRRELA